jgi:hypothetical protein
MENPWINFQEMAWQSDFGGDETGFEDVNIIGFYTWNDMLFWIDIETMEIRYIEYIGEDK